MCSQKNICLKSQANRESLFASSSIVVKFMKCPSENVQEQPVEVENKGSQGTGVINGSLPGA